MDTKITKAIEETAGLIAMLKGMKASGVTPGLNETIYGAYSSLYHGIKEATSHLQQANSGHVMGTSLDTLLSNLTSDQVQLTPDKVQYVKERVELLTTLNRTAEQLFTLAQELYPLVQEYVSKTPSSMGGGSAFLSGFKIDGKAIAFHYFMEGDRTKPESQRDGLNTYKRRMETELAKWAQRPGRQEYLSKLKHAFETRKLLTQNFTVAYKTPDKDGTQPYVKMEQFD